MGSQTNLNERTLNLNDFSQNLNKSSLNLNDFS